ncbi:hypothetical protein Cgig2_030100 [Carnegiea gigantea]|uniref:Uncharacterized protein n=1 Tax=Carnegiea gigantea TaxID=171969 RepID=A0A9Q1Q7K6_9CARY|nr:hypothetical protein Cgig2_030100 [Carnegiea gigantea]
MIAEWCLDVFYEKKKIQIGRVCTNCGVNMGEYFCEICKFYDDDVRNPLGLTLFFCQINKKGKPLNFIRALLRLEIWKSRYLVLIDKEQFHCNDCGICRVGGHENFFHCKKCGSCYSVALRDNHMCVENSMRHHCPICYEYLFDSLKDTTVLRCGHTMHCECYHEMIKRDKYICPICSKSVIDMSRTWKRLDEEIEATTMPEDYRNKKVLISKCALQVWILCNDCNDTTEVYFHIIGQKCSHCQSYNTRQIAPPVLPQS